MSVASAVIVAGGASRRFGGSTPKQFESVGGMPLLAHSMRAFLSCDVVTEVVVVVPAGGLEMAKTLLAPHADLEAVRLTEGGASRQESVFRGLEASSAARDPESLVAVHDGARPLVEPDRIRAVVEAAHEYGGAILAVPVVDTLKEVGEDGAVERTVPRERFVRAQTPQCFRLRLLLEAYRSARRDGFEGTDEASLVERTGATIRLVEGSERNLKVTTADDLARVADYLGRDA